MRRNIFLQRGTADKKLYQCLKHSCFCRNRENDLRWGVCKMEGNQWRVTRSFLIIGKLVFFCSRSSKLCAGEFACVDKIHMLLTRTLAVQNLYHVGETSHISEVILHASSEPHASIAGHLHYNNFILLTARLKWFPRAIVVQPWKWKQLQCLNSRVFFAIKGRNVLGGVMCACERAWCVWTTDTERLMSGGDLASRWTGSCGPAGHFSNWAVQILRAAGDS